MLYTVGDIFFLALHEQSIPAGSTAPHHSSPHKLSYSTTDTVAQVSLSPQSRLQKCFEQQLAASAAERPKPTPHTQTHHPTPTSHPTARTEYLKHQVLMLKLLLRSQRLQPPDPLWEKAKSFPRLYTWYDNSVPPGCLCALQALSEVCEAGSCAFGLFGGSQREVGQFRDLRSLYDHVYHARHARRRCREQVPCVASAITAAQQ